MNKPKPGEVYRHFKGHICKIIAIAKDSETLEEMVVYEHENEIWVRPLKIFTSKVDKEKYPNVEQEYRFILIEK
jgi:hypothetical protein